MSADSVHARQVSTSSAVVPASVIAASNLRSTTTLATANPNLSFGSAEFTSVQYPVSGVVGRCFVRVCLLVDLMTSWTRRGHPYEPPVASTLVSKKQV